MSVFWQECGLSFRTAGVYRGPVQCWLNGQWITVRARSNP